MAAASSEPTPISHTAAHLLFGVDKRIASTVFGTITVMATIAAEAEAFPRDPWTVVVLVASTAAVLWVAHVYAHGLAESISEQRPLRPRTLGTLAHRELGIVLAAVLPTAALVLGGLGVLQESRAVWLALGAGLATLAVQGGRYARLERLGATGTLLAVGVNLGLGMVVVALKVWVVH